VKKELAEVRGRLGKTQKQMSQLIDTSLKAIKNFEQGWRNIFLYVEKQILFLIAIKNPAHSIFQQLQTSLFDCNGMVLSSPPWHFGIDVC
jgi:DNA-binding XRE family transcriptional regulator